MGPPSRAVNAGRLERGLQADIAGVSLVGGFASAGESMRHGPPSSRPSQVHEASDRSPAHGSSADNSAPPDTAIRVLLVGNQAMILDGLSHVLAESPKMRLVASASFDEALAVAVEHQPDVVAILVNDEWQRTLEQLPGLLQAHAETAVLLLVPAHDSDAEERAIGIGVRGVILLEQPTTVLVKAIEKVHAGELWLDRARTAGLLQHVTRAHGDPVEAKIASLTRREMEIVRLIGEGLRNPQIAERLFISQATVRNHITSILAKLELADSFDVAVFAFRHGLVRFR
jgi:two-component system, NarL family, nitrate/nitrite response regulator NarL